MIPIASPYDNDFTHLHPKVRVAFDVLQQKLIRAELPFYLFEGYRPPERQDALHMQTPKVTNARGWQSSHQVGLAGDFVGIVHGKWSWSEDLPWERLAQVARSCGLDRPLTWDRPHIEATTLWRDLKRALR